MVLASLIAENPEREQVFYSIFSPENLISFDEVWSAIEGFGNEYFIKIYEERLATDKRPRLKKYFRFFLGKLYLAEGKESEAIEYFKAVLEDPDKDDPYQSLLMARTAEGMALATSGKERAAYTRRMFNIYPQLVPFSDLTMQFQLQTEGADTPLAKDILKDLRRSRIDFDGDDTAPIVHLKFSEQGKQVNVSYQVLVNGFAIRTGTLSLEEQDLSMGGVLLAYRIFNIQKSKASEQVPASPVKVETNPEKKAV
jgi:tetratricopeptide (TPR) repeat protein